MDVHEAILARTFVRVRPSQRRTRAKVRVCTSTTSSNSVGFFVIHFCYCSQFNLLNMILGA